MKDTIPTVNIVDRRKRFVLLPLKDILDDVLPAIDSALLHGIRNIILLDAHYRKGDIDSGRYVPIEGTQRADLEIYSVGFDRIHEAAKSSTMYLTFILLKILHHLLFTHTLRQTGKKKLSTTDEWKEADRLSDKETSKVFWGFYSTESDKAEWCRIQELIKSEKRNV